MLNKNLTYPEYQYLSKSRAQATQSLLVQALRDLLPQGYLLSTDPNLMRENTLLTVRPPNCPPGTKQVSLIHYIAYQSVSEGEAKWYQPTTERLRAFAGVAGKDTWDTDETFGKEGVIEANSANAGDMFAMVREVAAQVCAFPPFVNFEWRRCDCDEIAKWELFNDDRTLQSVWKSGDQYETQMGTHPATLAEAKAEAEAAARQILISEHQHRLTGLGQESQAEWHQKDDGEGESPGM